MKQLTEKEIELIMELDILCIYDDNKLKVFSKSKKDYIDEYSVDSYEQFNLFATVITQNELSKLEFCKKTGLQYKY